MLPRKFNVKIWPSLFNNIRIIMQTNTTLYEPRHAKTCFFDICGQRRPRSDCASALSDQGLHCPLTESSLDTTECMNGDQMSG